MRDVEGATAAVVAAAAAVAAAKTVAHAKKEEKRVETHVRSVTHSIRTFAWKITGRFEVVKRKTSDANQQKSS